MYIYHPTVHSYDQGNLKCFLFNTIADLFRFLNSLEIIKERALFRDKDANLNTISFTLRKIICFFFIYFTVHLN